MQHKTTQLLLKSVDEEQRIITGIASTGDLDRDNDIIEPSGAKYSLPIPFLWQHDREKPIGEVIAVQVIGGQIHITAKVAKIETEGKLKERVDEAWQSIKSGLVKGLSIGFKAVKYAYLERGTHYQEWEWRELSAVTIPANQNAVITGVKAADGADAGSLHDDKPPENPPNPPQSPEKPSETSQKSNDLPQPAAPNKAAFSLSNKSPNGQKVKNNMNIEAQIQAAREALQAKHAQLAEKETEKNAENADVVMIEKQCVAIDAELTAIENQIARLEKIQKAQSDETVTKAAAVPETPIVTGAPAIVQAANLPNLDKGIAFAQAVRAKMLIQHLARKDGVFLSPEEAVKHLGYSKPVLDMVTKATLGTTTDTGFAKPLVETQTFTQDFLELLRKATVFDKITGFRNVPFDVKINGQLTGGTAGWVGEGAKNPLPIPLLAAWKSKNTNWRQLWFTHKSCCAVLTLLLMHWCAMI